MKPAADAVVLDTTHMGVEQALAAALDVVRKIVGGATPTP
jgi:cytidylate kinase